MAPMWGYEIQEKKLNEYYEVNINKTYTQLFPAQQDEKRFFTTKEEAETFVQNLNYNPEIIYKFGQHRGLCWITGIEVWEHKGSQKQQLR